MKNRPYRTYTEAELTQMVDEENSSMPWSEKALEKLHEVVWEIYVEIMRKKGYEVKLITPPDHKSDSIE